jgi:F-type H+-transporting ATPase subunit a
VLGFAIYLIEILVAVLQAYIFTLLSAVYIQTSVHVEH